MFGRKKSGDADDPLTPGVDSIRPDENVLSELSAAFGTSSDDGDDGDGPDDDGDDNKNDVTAPAAADPLTISSTAPTTTDSDVPSTTGARVISIGGDDDFDAFEADSLGVVTPGKERSGTDSAGAATQALSGHPASPSSFGAHRGRSTIAIGGGDDLPDAMYLDEELDDGSGGTVFIDDDGTGDAIAPKDATSPGIEPRLRQRRIGVRRAASRKRLKWVALGVVVVLIVFGALTLLGSGLFAVDKVSVGGNVYTNDALLQDVITEIEGTPVLLVDTEAAEASLEAIPWVEDARVRTQFPSGATIEIRERTPVATMRGADGLFRVLDTEGRVLDVIQGQPVAFVLISGSGTLDLAAGAFAPIGPSLAAAFTTKFTPTIRPLVDSLVVSADGTDLVMNLLPGPAREQTALIQVRFGSAIGDSDQIQKLVRLEKLLEDLPDRTISEINVATDEVTVL